MAIKSFDKFDDTLVEDILDEANARDRLDLPVASLRAAYAIGTLQKLTAQQSAP